MDNINDELDLVMDAFQVQTYPPLVDQVEVDALEDAPPLASCGALVPTSTHCTSQLWTTHPECSSTCEQLCHQAALGALTVLLEQSMQEGGSSSSTVYIPLFIRPWVSISVTVRNGRTAVLLNVPTLQISNPTHFLGALESGQWSTVPREGIVVPNGQNVAAFDTLPDYVCQALRYMRVRMHYQIPESMTSGTCQCPGPIDAELAPLLCRLARLFRLDVSDIVASLLMPLSIVPLSSELQFWESRLSPVRTFALRADWLALLPKSVCAFDVYRGNVRLGVQVRAYQMVMTLHLTPVHTSSSSTASAAAALFTGSAEGRTIATLDETPTLRRLVSFLTQVAIRRNALQTDEGGESLKTYVLMTSCPHLVLEMLMRLCGSNRQNLWQVVV